MVLAVCVWMRREQAMEKCWVWLEHREVVVEAES